MINREEKRREPGASTAARTVDSAYRQILGRPTDAAGAAHYIAELTAGRLSEWTMRQDLADSAEARARETRRVADSAAYLASGGVSTRGVEGAEEFQWSYANTAEWASRFPDCDGKEQSPIEIYGATASPQVALRLDHTAALVTAVINNGHALQINIPPVPPQFAEFNGKRYSLKQLHFHAPSEHTRHGVQADAEAHLVHVADDGSLLVVGVLLRAVPRSTSRARALAALLVQNAPPAEGENEITLVVDPRDILPVTPNLFHYTGSLTTPPCTESVKWFVMEAMAEVDPALIANLIALFGQTARPTQAIGDRVIFYGSLTPPPK